MDLLCDLFRWNNDIQNHLPPLEHEARTSKMLDSNHRACLAWIRARDLTTVLVFVRLAEIAVANGADEV